ncbi:MAG: hypothetical protein HRU50_14555, partial [Winogradskyella sp.]|nr:hypothetical protein [Winogradskyella sp.]
MQFKTITLKKLPSFIALSIAMVLTSCGSYQYVGYDNDGIYSTERNEENAVVEQQPEVTTSTNSGFYEAYFNQGVGSEGESEIFTDVDSYESDYLERVQDTTEYAKSFGGWGQNNETVTINIIDNGWGWNNPWMWNAGWGWNDPWLWNGGWGWAPGWGWNAGWGRNRWGW